MIVEVKLDIYYMPSKGYTVQQCMCMVTPVLVYIKLVPPSSMFIRYARISYKTIL